MSSHYELLNEEVSESTREAEHALVRRLDRRLLAFAMLGNVIKQMPTSAGWKKVYYPAAKTFDLLAIHLFVAVDINATGLDYNWMGIAFTCGYLIMQTPSNMILSHARPSIYLPCLEVSWCVMTFAMAAVQSVHGVYIIRFLLGLFEAGFWPWRWTFIIDASFTAVLAVFGFKYLPDYPGNGTSWLSEEEHKLAIRRLAREGKATSKQGSFFSKATMRGLFCTWPLYMFIIAWVSLHISMGATAVLGIVARKSGYDAVTSNLFTAPSTLLNMITVVANGFLSDRLRTRKWCIVYPALLGVVGYCMLSAFVQPFGFLWFGFVLIHAGLGSTNSLVMTWLNEIVIESNDVRAMTIAIMNTVSQLSQMVTSLVLWPVTDAPQYHTGFSACIFFVILYILAILGIGHLQTKEQLSSKTLAKLDADDAEDIIMGEVTKGLLLSDPEDQYETREASFEYPHSSSRSRVPLAKDIDD
ncbi:hypothetical protein Unana1_01086 [Umbelopsis nana]